MGIINSDEFATVSSANGGELLKAYDVEINGHKTTVKLTDSDARRRGLLTEDTESDEVVELRAQVAELEAKLAQKDADAEAAKAKADNDAAAAAEKERAELEAKEQADAEAKAKAADAANKQQARTANKAAGAPANKGGAPTEAPKA